MWQLDVSEAIATIAFGTLGLGGDQRIVGDGKGQALENHQLERAAGDIHALPKRHRREQDRRLVFAKSIQQHVARGLALAEHRHGQTITQQVVSPLETTDRRKQHERPSTRRLDQFANPICDDHGIRFATTHDVVRHVEARV